MASTRTKVRATVRAFPFLLAPLLAAPVLMTVVGSSYYLRGHGERLRSPLHAMLKPSGTVGLAFGIAGLALFLFMWLYPMRKRFRWLAITGSVPAWLDVHIVAGLALPLLVAVHAGWRFDGLIGLGYLSMLLVAASGIVGRYLYVHLPRSQNGLEMSLDEVAAKRRSLVTEIAATMGLDPTSVERALTVDARPYEGADPLRTLARMLTDDFARWNATRALKRAWRNRSAAQSHANKAVDHALRLAQRELAMAQQVRMLSATRRVFGLWHVAHRPFAIMALIAVLVHVVVAVAVGAVKWS